MTHRYKQIEIDTETFPDKACTALYIIVDKNSKGDQFYLHSTLLNTHRVFTKFEESNGGVKIQITTKEFRANCDTDNTFNNSGNISNCCCACNILTGMATQSDAKISNQEVDTLTTMQEDSPDQLNVKTSNAAALNVNKYVKQQNTLTGVIAADTAAAAAADTAAAAVTVTEAGLERSNMLTSVTPIMELSTKSEKEEKEEGNFANDFFHVNNCSRMIRLLKCLKHDPRRAQQVHDIMLKAITALNTGSVVFHPKYSEYLIFLLQEIKIYHDHPEKLENNDKIQINVSKKASKLYRKLETFVKNDKICEQYGSFGCDFEAYDGLPSYYSSEDDADDENDDDDDDDDDAKGNDTLV